MRVMKGSWDFWSMHKVSILKEIIIVCCSITKSTHVMTNCFYFYLQMAQRLTLRSTLRPTLRPTLRSTLRSTPRPTLRPTLRSTLRSTLRPTLRPTLKQALVMVARGQAGWAPPFWPPSSPPGPGGGHTHSAMPSVRLSTSISKTNEMSMQVRSRWPKNCIQYYRTKLMHRSEREWTISNVENRNNHSMTDNAMLTKWGCNTHFQISLHWK